VPEVLGYAVRPACGARLEEIPVVIREVDARQAMERRRPANS